MHKLTALGMAFLLVIGGAGAVVVVADNGGSTGNDHIDDAEIDATYNGDDGELTVSALDEGHPIPNASVTVDDEEANLTGANGTVTFDATLSDGEEIEIEVEKGVLEGELEYVVDNGSLVLLSEEYEYDRSEDEEDAEDEEDEEDGEDAEDEEDEEDGDD